MDACAEDVYRKLMNIYHRLGGAAEVATAYRRCQTALAALQGLAPSAETQGLSKTLSAR